MSEQGEARLSSHIQSLVEEWMKHDQNPVTRKEIEQYAESGDESQLEALLGSRMTFGTAGLRAVMGAGYSRMNDLTIIQTTQGLASYIQEQFSKDELEQKRVVIGYDARHNSKRFAELTAGIFLNKNIKVYLFSGYSPTPYVAYAVKLFKCLAGIQITASHNPKEYNGYKVYWSNGAQIIPPHDVGIATSIDQQLVPWATSWDTSTVRVDASLRVLDPTQEVLKSYFSEIKKCCYRCDTNTSLDVKIIFTPMHGVGGDAVQRAFRAFNLPEMIPVVEQMEPDPEFPTVKFPNPEEGKSALDLAIQTAESVGSRVILATDPDADRLAVAEKDPVTGKWKIFSGNEAGAILSWWAMKNYGDSHPNYNGLNVYMLASTVSSKFIRGMAEVEGFQFEETLTGFKWMGNRSHQLIGQGKEVLFAYEEAIGYMYGSTVLDKDGISAAAILAECIGWLYSEKGTTLRQHLEDLYAKYGRYTSLVSYYRCYDKDTISKIFSRLRKDGKYPTTCGKAKVVSVVDLTVGYDSTRPPDFIPVLPTDANSQLITFTLDNRTVFTLRTSGTEPKIKYYVEVSSSPGAMVSKEDMQLILEEAVQSIIDDFLQAEKNGLLPRSE